MNNTTLDQEQMIPNMEHQTDGILKPLRFKSQLIHTSRKKLLFVTRYIKHKTLKQAYMFFYCLNKRYAKPILTFIEYVVHNIMHLRNISKEEAQEIMIRYIVLEKSSNKSFSLRYAAKGRAFRAVRVSTRLNMYLS